MTFALLTESPSENSSENVLHAIAHEIRQPLSAIESIAYYLSLALPEDDKHREQLARVQQLVEQSNWILSNGLGLAEARPAEPEAVDLDELITQAIAAHPIPADPPLQCDRGADPALAHLDPVYGRALIENILGLFRQLATEAHPVRLRTSAGTNGVEMEVSTAAPGYRSLTALPPGSALSLESAARIARLHGGSFTYAIDPSSGIRVQLMLP
jgi:signal transduction histidine kinase